MFLASAICMSPVVRILKHSEVTPPGTSFILKTIGLRVPPAVCFIDSKSIVVDLVKDMRSDLDLLYHDSMVLTESDADTISTRVFESVFLPSIDSVATPPTPPVAGMNILP